MRIISLLSLLFAYFSTTDSCTCKQQTIEESFCGADWVSHVKIDLLVTKQQLPDESHRKGLNNIKYAVEHVQIFKKPTNLTNLSDEIFTPSEAPACGLKIKAGNEYLLAGKYHNALYTVLCGQIIEDNANHKSIEEMIEWSNVKTNIADTLKAIQCK